MATISLEGMHFFAHHGVFEAERISGNDFEVDVWLELGEVALPDSDRIEDALDYGRIYTVTQAVMAEPRNLLETLVNAIGRVLMKEFPTVEAIRVRVSKHKPPVAGTCRRSVVEATFRP